MQFAQHTVLKGPRALASPAGLPFAWPRIARLCLRRPARGVSLVELMVTLSIVAILAVLGAPPMTQAMNRYEVRAVRDELTAALQLAEIEAARRSNPVVLLRITGCGLSLSGAQDWHCGYTLFSDTNGNGTQQGGEPTLKTLAMRSNVRLTHTTGGTDTVRMNPWGRAVGGLQRFVVRAGSGSGEVVVTVCLNLGAHAQTHSGDVPCP